jgi:type II secretory pathway pseudopilin PulG
MNKNKGFIGIGLILVIVIGIAVVGGGAYYIGKSKGENKEVKVQENNLPNNQDQNLQLVNQNQPVVENTQTDCNSNSTPSLTVLSPNGREVFALGQTINIKWSSKCINSNARIVVSIYKKGAQVSQEGSPYGYITTNTGSYSWTIPKDISSNQYEVNVEHILTNGNAVSDNSDNLFTINSETTHSEESSLEIFNRQPGAIKSIKSDGTNKWILAIDLLSSNPKWIPGDSSTGGFFINQNVKIRNLNITSLTKIQNCSTQYSGYASGFENNLLSFVSYVNKKIINPKEVGEFGYTAYFDISGSDITSIYEQCLP